MFERTIVSILLVFAAGTDGTFTCLHCNDVSNITECHNITRCAQNQICSVEKHLTKDLRMVYSTGCTDKDICNSPSNSTSNGISTNGAYVLCRHCCNSSVCNTQGCGDIGYPKPRGRICFACNILNDPYQCQNVTTCATNEMCVVTRTTESTGVRYQSGCRSINTCHNASNPAGPAIIGRRRRSTNNLPSCVKCCNADVCNDNCEDTQPLHICEDKSACAFLKQRFNVCSDPVVSRDICPKSCGLCSTTTTPVPVPCIDTFGNCAYLKQHFNICADANVARQSGCERTCGLCGHDNKDACQSSPCAHGSCISSANQYNCSCFPGYTGRNCNIDVNECASSPCVHGSCKDIENGYMCSCTPGYTGAHCEVDRDECAQTPCAHGTCVDGINMFTCLCSAGYTGTLCDRDIDECASSPCTHGFCEDRVNGYTCNCTTGYTGQNCDVAQYAGPCRDEDACAVLMKHIDVCSNANLSHEVCRQTCGHCPTTTALTTPTFVPCVDTYNNCGYLQRQFNICASRDIAFQSGCEKTCGLCSHGLSHCASHPCTYGICREEGLSYSCDCTPGYMGPKCESNIDECTVFPCVHGTCVDGIGSYSCSCTSGYTGQNCENDIMECASYPCQHGACIDGINQYICNCSSGYSGINCELDIDECTVFPCVHGTCVDGIGSYSCSCTSGYTGQNCENDIMECASSPCQHGACIDGINQYICNCSSGYSGINCEIDVNECLTSPCVHGNCSNTVGGYKCSCEERWAGKNCDIVDHCLSSPCQHGTCSNSKNDFTCSCSSGYAGKTCNLVDVRDCKDILQKRVGRTSGVYQIFIDVNGTLQQFQVYCDMDTEGGGWTVFQNRFDGSVDFYQNFREYENGFGSISGEFWLGLKWVHFITKNKAQELRIDITTQKGEAKYETYHNFSLGPPSDYKLHVSYASYYTRSGDAGNGLNGWHNNHRFLTKDMPQSCPTKHCAVACHGGYWYGCCAVSNLNGKYHLTSSDDPGMGFYWGYPEYLSASQMKFRRK